jgi:hypothetical protein
MPSTKARPSQVPQVTVWKVTRDAPVAPMRTVPFWIGW